MSSTGFQAADGRTARPEPPEPLPVPDGIEHRFIEANGSRFHIAEAGSGPPLMLIHGGPQHWYAWRHIIPALAERYRVICPDLRGFGWSDAPRTGYTIPERARDMIAVLDALGIGRVQLAGHDWGGMIGFQMCFDARERIERFMAISINHPWQRWWPGLSNDWRLWYQALLAAPGVGPWLQRRSPGFLRLMLRLGVRDPEGVWLPGEQEHYASVVQHPDRAAAQSRMYRALWTRSGLKAMMRSDRLDLPILLLHGTRDFAVGTRIQRTGWQEHAPQMNVEFVAGGSHWLLNERPELIVARAREFFSADAPGAPGTAPAPGLEAGAAVLEVELMGRLSNPSGT